MTPFSPSNSHRDTTSSYCLGGVAQIQHQFMPLYSLCLTHIEISPHQFVCVCVQVGIIWNGIESIRELEKFSAPILIILSGALLAWAYVKAGGFGPMLSAPSQFVPGGSKAGQFWQYFFPALTANVGFWATLSLNIPGNSQIL